MNQILALQYDKLVQGYSGLAKRVSTIRRAISVPGRSRSRADRYEVAESEARLVAPTSMYLHDGVCSVRYAKHLPLEVGLGEVGPADGRRGSIGLDHEAPAGTVGRYLPRIWQATAAMKFCRLQFRLAEAKRMLRGVHVVLCATRRRLLLIGVAAAAFPLIVILILLEISYRYEVAREASLVFTNSLSSSPAVDPAKLLKFEAEHPQLPLARPIVPFAPPTQPAVADASPPAPPQGRPQSDVVVRDPVPLPRSRPNRF